MNTAGRTLFWVGNPYFCHKLKALGWNVIHHKPSGPQAFSWEQLLQLCGCEPEILVLGDASTPPLFMGVEKYPCLTVFFCVDSHIHSWHPAYAQAFDLCCLNLKDNLPHFEQRLGGDRLRWMPLFAPDTSCPAQVPESEKRYDLLFAGNVSPLIHPGRHAFLNRLAARCPALTVTRGKFQELFPQARLVFNYAERGDLNFRVFQALGFGACLLTPRVGHGMLELFREGEEIFCYDPEDMEELLQIVEVLLAAPALRQAVAARGCAAVDAGHRASHRAGEFSQWLLSQDWNSLISQRSNQAEMIHERWLRLLYLHFAASLPSPLKDIYYHWSGLRP